MRIFAHNVIFAHTAWSGIPVSLYCKTVVMKRIIILAALVAVSTACTKNIRWGNCKFSESDRLNESEEFAPDYDSLYYNVDVNYAIGGASQDAIDLINSNIRQEIHGTGDVRTTVEEDLKSGYEFYRKDLEEQLEDMYKGDPALIEDRHKLVYQTDITGQPTTGHGNLMSYEVYTYYYEGGAHGSSGITPIVFDKATGKKVRETDIFKDGYYDTLHKALCTHLHDVLDDESYSALFTTDIESNGMFTVSDKGITYIYGEYEIGPYYLGNIRVTVPWDELSGYVNMEVVGR